MYPGLLPDRVFGFGVEAGAGFGGEFAVAVDGGLRVERAQTRKQFRKGAALGRGAGVGGMAGRVEAADIADADGAAVVADTVGAGHVERAPRLYGSVKGDDEVIADVGLEFAPRFRGGAVDDDLRDVSAAHKGRIWNLGKGLRWRYAQQQTEGDVFHRALSAEWFSSAKLRPDDTSQEEKLLYRPVRGPPGRSSAGARRCGGRWRCSRTAEGRDGRETPRTDCIPLYWRYRSLRWRTPLFGN